MKSKKIKNPMRTRVWRELRYEWRKYLVIFIFLVLMIGFVSGMYVANNSMLIATDEVKTSEKREDGHFILKEKADADLFGEIEEGDKVDVVKAYYINEAYDDVDKEAIAEAFKHKDYRERIARLYEEADRIAEENYQNALGDYELDDPYFRPVPVTLVENFRKDTDEDIDGDGERDSGIRLYILGEDINTPCIHEGRLPQSADEIAIDRMHAANRGISVGDKINIGGKDLSITGLISLPNYSTLHEDPSDTMFDALTFDVALMTEEGWKSIDADTEYEYGWFYENKPADEKEEKRYSDRFLKVVLTQAAFADNELTAYTPEYANGGINFAPDDFGSDKAMGGVLLDILIVVLAFIFAITETNTIAKEAPVIGTLRASGYTRRELTMSYMTAPVIVTLAGAAVGNLLGYTLFKKVVVAMYYNSYSLPTYETVFTSEALIKTTIVPIVLMFFINLIIIARKMRFSPLRFLRNDLKTSRRKRAIKLPDFSFFRRFRIRIFMQNIPGYFVTFAGILFVMVMLAMAVGMPETLDWYQERAGEMMLADYQVVLTSDHDEDGNAIMTANEDAEKFNIEEVLLINGDNEESISAYGMEPGNRYAEIPEGLTTDDILISTGLAGKLDIGEGDVIKIREKFGSGNYELTVKGIVEYDGAVCIFTDFDCFGEMFDRDAGRYDGFFTNEEVTDVDDDFIAAVITKEDIIKIAAQLDHSMGAYMLYFQFLCILLSAVLLYLLTKVIVERNEKSISMTKILGYNTGEIARLYLLTTTVVVILSEVISIFLSEEIMKEVWRAMMQRLGGYYPYVLTTEGMIRMCVIVFAGYLIVAALDFRRIKRVPMDEALKNME